MYLVMEAADGGNLKNMVIRQMTGRLVLGSCSWPGGGEGLREEGEGCCWGQVEGHGEGK